MVPLYWVGGGDGYVWVGALWGCDIDERGEVFSPLLLLMVVVVSDGRGWGIIGYRGLTYAGVVLYACIVQLTNNLLRRLKMFTKAKADKTISVFVITMSNGESFNVLWSSDFLNGVFVNSHSSVGDLIYALDNVDLFDGAGGILRDELTSYGKSLKLALPSGKDSVYLNPKQIVSVSAEECVFASQLEVDSLNAR